VKLDRADARLVAFPHQCEGEALGHPSLARSRRSLQDQVLAHAQALQQAVDLPALQKTALAQDVVNIVWHSWRWRLDRIDDSRIFFVLIGRRTVLVSFGLRIFRSRDTIKRFSMTFSQASLAWMPLMT